MTCGVPTGRDVLVTSYKFRAGSLTSEAILGSQILEFHTLERQFSDSQCLDGRFFNSPTAK